MIKRHTMVDKTENLRLSTTSSTKNPLALEE